MIERGVAGPDEVVLAFIRAEIDSPRFGPVYTGILARAGRDRATIVDHPDRTDAAASHFRHAMLKSIRGWGDDRLLFTGFPDDTQWRRVELEPAEVAGLRYANHGTWRTLSGGSRRVADGAANLGAVDAPENANANVRAVAAAMASGHRYPPLVIVQGPDGTTVIVEGHTRATAHVAAGITTRLPALLGTSFHMTRWAYY